MSAWVEGGEPLRLDPTSAQPASAQLRDLVTRRAQSGELPPQHRLPSVRRLAEELGIAPGTVAKAYRELERAGVVETRGRGGTVVLGRPDAVDEAGEAARTYAERVRSLGVEPERAIALVRAALVAAST